MSKEANQIQYSKHRASREELKRLIRNPHQLSDRFGVKDDDSFVYRVVLCNSQFERNKVERFQKMGYDIVDNPTTPGQSRTGDPARQGSSSQFKRAGGEEFVVMRIPRHFYEENQQLKREVFAQQLEMDGNYQKQKVTRGKGNVNIDGGVITMDTPTHLSNTPDKIITPEDVK